MARRRSGSVTTTHRQFWASAALGARVANSTQCRISSRGTGRVRSRRLRTARVVDSNRSTVSRSNSVAGTLWVLPKAAMA
jgi:hypothetical protein